jgi:uncharacterized protein (DUF433 family)
MSTTFSYKFLEPRPKSSYRQLFIKGTRIRAELVYRAHINVEEPMTPEEVAADYGVPLSAVREAIKYCRSNPPEIAADLAREEALMAARGQLDPDYRRHPQPRLLSPQDVARLREP